MDGIISEKVANLGVMYLMTTVSGGLVFLLWRFLYKAFDSPGHLHVIYYVLRLVLLFFLVPFSYWIVMTGITDFSNGSTMGLFGCTSPVMRTIFFWFTWVWISGLLMIGILYVRNLCLLWRIKRSSEPVGWELQMLMDSCRREMGISQEISLYQNGGIPSAFTGGWRRPFVILPESGDYSLREYELILQHELVHIKYHDVMWSNVVNLVWWLHWLNPLAWYLVYWNRKWCEAHCDYECVRILGDGREYSELLFKMAKRLSKDDKTYLAALSLFHDKKTTKERITRMYQYQKLKKQKKGIALAAMAGFLVLSVTSVSAASYGIVKGQETWLLSTMVYEEEAVVPWENYLEEEEFREEDLIQAGYSEVENEDGGISAYASGSVSGRLAPDKYKKSASFTAKSGGTIFVSAVVTPDNKKVSAGIIEPDGTWRGVTSTGAIDHEFSLDQTGAYRVYIRNDNSATVTINTLYHD